MNHTVKQGERRARAATFLAIGARERSTTEKYVAVTVGNVHRITDISKGSKVSLGVLRVAFTPES